MSTTSAASEPPSLTLDVLREAYQTVINASTLLWYGTDKGMTRGKMLASLESDPPFVIIHPDDVPLLPEGVRHLREYRPTREDLARQAQKWLDDWWKELR